MQANSVGASGQTGAQNPTGQDAFRNLDMDEFLKMMIVELQNQDPLNPMDNQQILQQISQIREIESNLRMTDTLDSVLVGQNLASAVALLGKLIVGLSDAGQKVTGVVERVSMAEGKVKLHVGESTVSLKNIEQIMSE